MLVEKPGRTVSGILADAVTAWFSRRAVSQLGDRFGLRLGRIHLALTWIERRSDDVHEMLALFVRYELAIHTPPAKNDEVGSAIATKRFDAFVERVRRQLLTGKRTIDEPGDGA
jgi:hypothetical protein